jgi:ferritin-like metal-binding protein YciE
MAPDSLRQQLTKHLTDAHSIEEQALVQMRIAPRIAGDDAIAAAFSNHLAETEGHVRLVTAQLQAHGVQPSRLKDIVGAVTGAGFGAFAAAQPDTPGKLVVHAFSYEHMEAAAYALVGRLAERVGDEPAAEMARTIEREEQAMGDHLATLFDRAVDASLRATNPDDLRAQLDKYLADAHAIEAQALQLLKKSPKLAGDDELASAYREHREETEEHQRLVAARLDARGATPSKLKNAALRLGALNWGMFFQAQPDTPAKLAAFAFAFEHLEIASYEMLRRVALRAHDAETEQIATRILAQERAAAERIRALFDRALDAPLHEQGVGAR